MESAIAARPEQVWSLLTDATRYPVWNPEVVAIKGTVADGERIIVRALLDKPRTFRAKVVIPRMGSGRFHPPIPPPEGWTRGEGDYMVWRGGIPLGLLSQVRVFTVTPTAGGVSLQIEQYFSGPLMSVPFVRRLLGKDTMMDWVQNIRKATEV